MGDNEVERLRALTLDLLGGNGQWMSYIDIAEDFRARDGAVDPLLLVAALDDLAVGGHIQRVAHAGEIVYRSAPPQQGESLVDKVKRLEAENERLRSRDAKLIADLKAVDAWTGDGDVETLARRLWSLGVQADDVERIGTEYVARSLLQDLERLEAMSQRLDAECLALVADAQHALEERDQLRAEQAADRAAARALVDALPKCMWDCDQTATGEDVCDGRQRVCDEHKCKRFGGSHVEEHGYAAPLRALQTLMAAWPSDGERRDVVETDEQPSSDWDGIGLTPTIAHNEEWWARKRAEFIEMIRLAGDPGTSMLAVGNGYAKLGAGKRPATGERCAIRPDDGAAWAAMLAAPVTHERERGSPHLYVGEFGDIDEPSVGDVEGYGVGR
jgi:hypothetical protein